MPKFCFTHVEHVDDSDDPSGHHALIFFHASNGDVEAKARYRTAGMRRLKAGDIVVGEGRFDIDANTQPCLAVFGYEKYAFNGDIDDDDIIGPLLRTGMDASSLVW